MTVKHWGGDKDVINHPEHYTEGGIEAIQVLEAKMSPEEFRAYLYGSALKYLLRCKYKGKEVEDLSKGQFYLNLLLRKHDERLSKTGDDAYVSISQRTPGKL